MFGKKKMWLLLAAATLVAACGGGGGGGPALSGNVGTPPVDNGNNSPDPADGTDQPGDQRLNGHLALVANQLVFIRTDRSIYNALPVELFESDKGMYDVASGSDGQDAGAPVPATYAAPAAPVAAFGFRVSRFVQPDTDGEAVGNQTVVGRIAFDFTERDTSPGILAGESAEIMKFVIDGVELATGENGELLSAQVQYGAQMHVYGRSATGVELRETIAVPANAVRLLPISEVLDHYGDTSSTVLLADLEAAFSGAGQRLAALENMAGHFSMQVTISAADLVRPASPESNESPAVERKELVGQAITVDNQPPVTGGGVIGNAWIRLYPPE